MSAADLFKDSSDADFRLRGTYLYIGREPYSVLAVSPNNGTLDPKEALLYLKNVFKGEELTVKLGRMPLKTMTACPHGYYEGLWYARGPARHRYQGITGSSFWCVMQNGAIETGGVGNTGRLLKELSLQPRTRRPGKRPSGAVTRDVLINNNGQVLVRGILRGVYQGENTVKPLTEVSPLTQMLFDNAKLTLVDKPKIEVPELVSTLDDVIF